ncbi:unnamed protein product [Sphenostylis stenocarpa]|uniref:Uncharacterized protein n=1 Tax=Sphenostylis stenocarpa TaxID=92480 RepID=A0AA86VK30_9FABA|nr:unnamed protein product [Sphenostylis stenocarpa]
MASARAIPSISLDNRTTVTLGAHSITKPLEKNMIDDAISIGRLPNTSETVPENIVTTVPVRNAVDMISPSSVGSSGTVKKGKKRIQVWEGDRENYEELVDYLHPKKNLNPDEVALLVTTLKALSGAVSYIDYVHHESLLFAVSRMSFWNFGTEVMDALQELIVSLMLVKHSVPPFYLLDSVKQENGIERKSKALSGVHAALKEIADLVPRVR